MLNHFALRFSRLFPAQKSKKERKKDYLEGIIPVFHNQESSSFHQKHDTNQDKMYPFSWKSSSMYFFYAVELSLLSQLAGRDRG